MTFVWPNYEPVKVQVASLNAVTDFMDSIRRPSIGMNFDKAFPGNRGIRKELIRATNQHVLAVC